MKNSMDILNAAAFSSADALFCMFLWHSPSVFKDISIFEDSTSPSNLSEVGQQVQELLGGTDRQIVWLYQLTKLLFPYQSTIKIADLGYGSLGDRQFHSRALSAGKVKPEEHRNSLFMSSSKNSQADKLS